MLALAGGPGLERCLDFVRPKGRVACPNGVEPTPAARRTFALRAYDAVASPAAFARLGARLARARVPIAASYPLGKAAQVHRRLERPHLLGRLVLQVRRRR